jgi:hypothetical protein
MHRRVLCMGIHESRTGGHWAITNPGLKDTGSEYGGVPQPDAKEETESVAGAPMLQEWRCLHTLHKQ